MDFGWFLWFPGGSHPSGTYEFALFFNGLGSFWASGRAEGCVFYCLCENHKNSWKSWNSWIFMKFQEIPWKPWNLWKFFIFVNLEAPKPWYSLGIIGVFAMSWISWNFTLSSEIHEIYEFSSFPTFPLKSMKKSYFMKEVPDGAQGT